MGGTDSSERWFFTTIGVIAGLVVAVGLALGAATEASWTWHHWVVAFAGMPIVCGGFMLYLSVCHGDNRKNSTDQTGD